jgi:hypothetical protein
MRVREVREIETLFALLLFHCGLQHCGAAGMKGREKETSPEVECTPLFGL